MQQSTGILSDVSSHVNRNLDRTDQSINCDASLCRYRCTARAMARWSTVLSGVFLALSMVLSLGKLLMLAAGTGNNGEITEADQWLAEIGLAQYRPLFRKKGKRPMRLGVYSRIFIRCRAVDCPTDRHIASVASSRRSEKNRRSLTF